MTVIFIKVSAYLSLLIQIKTLMLIPISIDYFETLLQAPGSVGVPPYHAKYIKPLTQRFEK